MFFLIGCVLKDSHPGFVQYHVLSNNVTWGALFSSMEEAKEKFGLENYSVGQTTLEQVFFNFTKGGRPDQDIGKKSCLPLPCL